jgi:hypothetical protein
MDGADPAEADTALPFGDLIADVAGGEQRSRPAAAPLQPPPDPLPASRQLLLNPPLPLGLFPPHPALAVSLPPPYLGIHSKSLRASGDEKWQLLIKHLKPQGDFEFLINFGQPAAGASLG